MSKAVCVHKLLSWCQDMKITWQRPFNSKKSWAFFHFLIDFLNIYSYILKEYILKAFKKKKIELKERKSFDWIFYLTSVLI